jgi:hypothetical protein
MLPTAFEIGLHPGMPEVGIEGDFLTGLAQQPGARGSVTEDERIAGTRGDQEKVMTAVSRVAATVRPIRSGRSWRCH